MKKEYVFRHHITGHPPGEDGCPQNTTRLNIAEIGNGSLIVTHWVHSHKCVMMTCWPYCDVVAQVTIDPCHVLSGIAQALTLAITPPSPHTVIQDTQAWALFQLVVRPPLLSPSECSGASSVTDCHFWVRPTEGDHGPHWSPSGCLGNSCNCAHPQLHYLYILHK